MYLELALLILISFPLNHLLKKWMFPILCTFLSLLFSYPILSFHFIAIL